MSSGNGPSSPDQKDGSSSGHSGTMGFIVIVLFFGIVVYFAVYYIKNAVIDRRGHLPSPHASPGTSADANNSVGSRNLGLDPENISLLPTFPYQPSKRSRRKEGQEHEEKGSTVECAVCLGELEEGEMVRVLPTCKHYFHVNCIDLWLSARSSCPMCRAHPEPEKVRLGLVSLSPPWRQLTQSRNSSERRQFSFGSCLGSPFMKTPNKTPSTRGSSPFQRSWQGSPSIVTTVATPPRNLQEIPAETRTPEISEIREIP